LRWLYKTKCLRSRRIHRVLLREYCWTVVSLIASFPSLPFCPHAFTRRLSFLIIIDWFYRTFRPQDAPNYTPAFIFLVVSSVMCMSLSLVYRQVCIYQNTQREVEGSAERYDHAYDDLTDKEVCGVYSDQMIWPCFILRGDTTESAIPVYLLRPTLST
jgi:hypothetical protein